MSRLVSVVVRAMVVYDVSHVVTQDEGLCIDVAISKCCCQSHGRL